MNKLQLATFFILLFSTTTNFGQEKKENIVKAGIVVGNLGIQYERSLSDHFSIIGQLGYSEVTTTVNNVDSTSFGLGYYLEGRYYFSSNRDLMEGWHIGPFYNSINTKDDDELKTNVSSLGLAAGYQWVFNSQITLGIVFGGGSLDVNSDIPNTIYEDDIGFLPHFGFALGYSF